MREMAVQAVREQVEGYLKTGEVPPIRHMGHIVPYGSPVVLNPGTPYQTMHGGWVDSPIKKEAIVGGVGTTTVGNLELQRDFDNRSQKNVLTPTAQSEVNEAHRKWLKSKGYGIGIGTFLGLLFAGHSEEGFTMDQFGKTVKDPWYWSDIFSGLDSRGFAKGMQEEYKEFTGDTYTEDWNKSKEFWSAVPKKIMGLLKPEEEKERESIWT